MEADVKAEAVVLAKALSTEGRDEIPDTAKIPNNISGKNGYKKITSDKAAPEQQETIGDNDESAKTEPDTESSQSTACCIGGVENKLDKLTISAKDIQYVDYQSELQLPDITGLITLELSEPYSIYTYRYFLHNWPHLSYLAYSGSLCVGAVVCKLDFHQSNALRGYIAMLVVHKEYRRLKIGSHLVERAIERMIQHGCDEIVLETEVTNKGALRLYENLGFVRDKRLLRYYLNGVDAWRLKLWR